jgi:hypothetical protein
VPEETDTMKANVMVVTLLVAAMARAGIADEPKPAQPNKKPEPVFWKIAPEEVTMLKTAGAVLLGNYALDPTAARSLRNVETLKQALDRIDALASKKPTWDKQNAELTIRQLMDTYLDTALAFYEGKGDRGMGRRADRWKDYTDLEIGDQQLSSALVSVQWAAAWDVPLKPGQEEKLDALMRKRLDMLEAAAP